MASSTVSQHCPRRLSMVLKGVFFLKRGRLYFHVGWVVRRATMASSIALRCYPRKHITMKLLSIYIVPVNTMPGN